ncbi:MAG: hypothetical protein JWL91_688 [Sphingomonas bacterium]|nr:hypothetical protein [Sphingomonas bacterium]
MGRASPPPAFDRRPENIGTLRGATPLGLGSLPGRACPRITPGKSVRARTPCGRSTIAVAGTATRRPPQVFFSCRNRLRDPFLDFHYPPHKGLRPVSSKSLGIGAQRPPLLATTARLRPWSRCPTITAFAHWRGRGASGTRRGARPPQGEGQTIYQQHASRAEAQAGGSAPECIEADRAAMQKSHSAGRYF